MARQASAAAAKRELAEPYAAAELALAPPTIGVEGVCHLPRAAGTCTPGGPYS